MTIKCVFLGHYRNQTNSLFSSDSINALDASKLTPGDFAVTADGAHVLNYLGGNQWIEADPNLMKVVIETVPTNNYWFGVPVVVLRWNFEP